MTTSDEQPTTPDRPDWWTPEYDRLEQSANQWAAEREVELPDKQRDRLVKFLNDWTRQ